MEQFVQNATGVSLKKIITSLRLLQEFTGRVGGLTLAFDPEISVAAQEIVDALVPARETEH